MDWPDNSLYGICHLPTLLGNLYKQTLLSEVILDLIFD